MGQAERSNLLIKTGVSLRDGWFDPGWALLYGVGVKVLSYFLLAQLVDTSLWTHIVWLAGVLVSLSIMTARLCHHRFYFRPDELKRMSLMEIISIYAPIPLMLPWSWAIPLMLIGVAFFYLMNRALWDLLSQSLRLHVKIYIYHSMILFNMVKRIFLSLDDNDFEKLKALKGDRTWEKFLVKPHLEVFDEDLRKLNEAEG